MRQLKTGIAYQMTPYCTWNSGTTKILVARNKPNVSPEKFQEELSKHLFLARNILVPQGLRGYLVYVGADFEIALLNFESEQQQQLIWGSKESVQANVHAASFLELVSFTTC